jgi:RsiW-degrading membrane proteinase PrsW (M82 family)
MERTSLPALRAPEKGAPLRLWLLVGCGMLTILPVMLASALTLPLLAAIESAQMRIAVLAYAGSSLPEEAVRFGVLMLVGLRWFGMHRPRDGILFGLLVALGFSIAENIFYGVSVGWATGLIKLAIATPMHLALGITMGGLIAVGLRAPEQRSFWFAAAFAVPLLLHGTYDFMLLTALADTGTGAIGRLASPAIVYMLVAVIAVLTVMRARQPARGLA